MKTNLKPTQNPAPIQLAFQLENQLKTPVNNVNPAKSNYFFFTAIAAHNLRHFEPAGVLTIDPLT
jgi:hypothetical protein